MGANGFSKSKPFGRLIFTTALLATGLITTPAEQLPVRTYTTAEGLLRDEVNRIRQDSHGFLWFCTSGGLSRFDGYGFTNYTMDDGLPAPAANDLVEGSDGTIWVATTNGLVRFNPRGVRAPYSPQTNPIGNQMFEVFLPGSDRLNKEIAALLADEHGLIWVATGNGLYQMQINNGRPQFEKTAISYQTTSIIKDHRDGIWAGTFFNGLYRLSPDGSNIVQSFSSNEGLPKVHKARSEPVQCLLEDKAGVIWVGHRSGGVCCLTFDAESNRYAVSGCYNKKDGLSANWVDSLFQSADGSLWIGTATGLNRVSGKDAANRPAFKSFTAAQGFCDDSISDITEDRDGNFWIATQCGLKKWTPGGFTSYDTKDGLSSTRPVSFLETIGGEMIVTDLKSAKEGRILNLFKEGSFKPIRPNYPAAVDYWGWGWRQTVLQTRDGEWWIPVGMSGEYRNRFKELPPDGPLLVRFPKVQKLEDLTRVKPKAVYRPRDGLLGYDVFRLYEDHNGDVWIITLDPSRLFRWNRKTEGFQELTEAADIGVGGYILVLGNDRAGNLWIGGEVRTKHNAEMTFTLARYKGGRFTWFTTADGLPQGSIRDLLIDEVGRLWIATARGGVLRVDDPNAEGLRFTAFTTAQGLSDNATLSLTEDRFGRIYVGSGRGVDRLDPATGAVKHFTTADGLPREEMILSYTDRTGALWFGSIQGLARYVPEPERLRQSPNILLTGLRVSNVAQAVSALGESELPGFEFTHSQNNVSVDFLGLGASLGEELQYKYMLEGADADWTTTKERTVNFSNLAPGSYRFLVKATTTEGIESESPAVFTFTILSPVWQRWWFLALMVSLAAAAAYALYRYRVARLVELERVRTRIATDLHDDIGANLSLIAAASEVVRRRSRQNDYQTRESLSLISDTSRELVDAMGDIVWAVNPSKDHLSDLTKKMRRFASDVFSARNITLKFHAPGDDRDIKLGADTRREIFLIFKEGVNNIARHSKCTEADIELHARDGWLVLKLSDDGKGFDVTDANEGSGLASMRQRAARLSGKLDIVSKDGKGTTVTLQVPLGRRSRN